jgi:CheY-like chemotaxis protein
MTCNRKIWRNIYMENRKRVLVIDDSRAVASAVRGVLQKQGYEVVTALNGTEGFDKAREVFPDVIIFDIVMPGVDGYEVGYRLRQDPETAEIPIIFLSARGNSEAEENASALEPQEMNLAFSCGANDFLHKPVADDDLVRSVKNVLWFSEIASPV